MTNIELKNGQIKLNSHLDEYSFGKTNFDSIMSQKGIFFDGENFSDWKFDEVKSFKEDKNAEPIVFYCGKSPFSKEEDKSVQTLADFLQEDTDQAFEAGRAVIQVLTKAAKEEVALPAVGGGAILIASSKTGKSEKSAAGEAGSGSTGKSEKIGFKVLFLPQELFVNSLNANGGEEKADRHGKWINPTLEGLPFVCFERACIAYKLLTKQFPFSATDEVERNADILDRKFLPIEMAIDGLDPTLATEIDRGLKLNANSVNVPGKKQKGKNSEDLTPTADFPLDLLAGGWKTANTDSGVSAQEFAKRAESFLKAQNSRIAAKRKLRRNSSAIIAIVIVGIVLGILIGNTISGKKSELTSIGLTSNQTVQAFMYGINTKSTILLSNITKGKKVQSYVDTVGQIYVLDKQRKMYGRDNGYASPENWCLYSVNEEGYKSGGIYGVSQLSIDKMPCETGDIKIYSKADKVPPITMEGGIELKDGEISVHTADYYLIHSEGIDETLPENSEILHEPYTILVGKVHETFTLTYKKDRWLITKIETETETIPLRTSTFHKDWIEALQENDSDIVETANSLRKKYPWLPTEQAIRNEAVRIVKEREELMMGL